MAGTTKNAYLLNDLNLDSLNHVLGLVQREVDRLTGLLGEIIFRNTIEAPIARTTGSFRAADGTAAAPSYTFTADTDTGLYRSTTNTLGVSAAGVSALTISDSLANFNVTLEASPIVVEAGAAATGELRFEELTGVGSNYVGFKGATSIAANKVWILPSADGSSGQMLTTDGALTLSWTTPAGTSFGSVGGSIDVGDTASDGSNATASRSDHQHAFTAPGAGYPLDVAAAEADGVATTPARSDHVHALGIGTTKGDLIARNTTAWQRRAVGTDGQVLTADSGEVDGIKWAAAAGSGETNTASNVGVTGGVGVFHQKTGVDLEFKKLGAGTGTNRDSWGGVTVENDTTTNTIQIETEEMQWEHSHNLWELIGHDGFDYDESTGQLWITGANGVQTGGTELIAAPGAFGGHTSSDTSTTSSQFTLTKSRVGPAAVQSGDSLGAISFRGYTGAAYTGSKGFISAITTENWSATANGTKMDFRTTPNTTTTLTARMTIDQNGNIGVGTTTPQASSLLDLSSTTGALLVPRMTTAQRDALTAVVGQVIYNVTTGLFNGYQGAVPAWLAL